LIIGCRGMLGRDLMKVLAEKFDVNGVDIDEVDIRNADSVRNCLREHEPEVVINSAAYTDVDGAESDPEAAFETNVGGAKNVAIAAKEIQAKSVYFSTDYIFDGSKGKPYVEDDEPNPRGVYARSKYEGETAVIGVDPAALVIRTAWLYGAGGKNFVDTIIGLAGKSDELRVVDDQRGSPTWSRHLAEATSKLTEAGAEGIVHVTNSGDTTWRGFAKEIFRKLNRSIKMTPITTDQLGRPAPRPAYSVLDTSKYKRITGQAMPHWKDALDGYLKK